MAGKVWSTIHDTERMYVRILPA